MKSPIVDNFRTMDAMDSYWAAVIWSLLPTVVVLGLFVFVLRSILRMDRTERRSYAKIEAEERAKRGLAPKDCDQRVA